jgi:hypothetical protein
MRVSIPPHHCQHLVFFAFDLYFMLGNDCKIVPPVILVFIFLKISDI